MKCNYLSNNRICSSTTMGTIAASMPRGMPHRFHTSPSTGETKWLSLFIISFPEKLAK